MRLIVFVLLMVILAEIPANAQNLIPNPGFEEHEQCLGLNTRVSAWVMPTNNYYHYLCDCPVAKAQYSGEEMNKVRTGKGFAGVCLYGREAGEYMLVKLNQTLSANTTYYFSGYVLLAAEKQNNYQNFKRLEIGFSDKEFSVKDPSYIFFDPQVLIPVTLDPAKKEWVFVSGTFTATGNESYMVIGNFLPSTPIADELAEYMQLSPADRESYLRKHKKLADALNQYNDGVLQESKPYSIRVYFDDLCLMPLSACENSGGCNYPIKKAEPPVVKMEVNKPMVLENIFFETGKSTLLPASYPALDSLAQWLNKNPGVEILIAGHTDNKGAEPENQKLSEDRAAAVRTYLISKQVKNKIDTKGFGSTRPVAGNDSEAGRSKNRRVEFTITKQ